MSRTKAFIFDRLPEDDGRRAELAAPLFDRLAELPIRIPTRRRNALPGSRWSPLWPNCLAQASADLGVETLRVNDNLHVGSEQDAAAIVTRAEHLLTERQARLAKLR